MSAELCPCVLTLAEGGLQIQLQVGWLLAPLRSTHLLGTRGTHGLKGTVAEGA